MKLVDLTLQVAPVENAFTTKRLLLAGVGGNYTALVYDYHHTGMVSTYIDFPGHIAYLDNGTDAATCAMEKVYRVPARVIHLDCADGSGAVTAGMLKSALKSDKPAGAMIINALGRRRFDEIAYRSVWLASDAVAWIVESGSHLLVSDIYESPALHGVFPSLFAAGIYAVCHPVNLHLLPSDCVRITALPLKFEGATQLPCRLLAECEQGEMANDERRA